MKKKYIIIILIVIGVMILLSIGGVFAIINIKNIQKNNKVEIKEENKKGEKIKKEEVEKEQDVQEPKETSNSNDKIDRYFKIAYYYRNKLLIEADSTVTENKDTGIELLEKYGLDKFYGCKYSMLEKEYDNTLKEMIVMNSFNLDSSTLESVNGKETEEVKHCKDIFDGYEINDKNYPNPTYIGKMGICPINYETYVIPYEKANKIYNELFNTNMPKENIDGSKLGINEQYAFEYIESKNIYALLESSKYLGSCSQRFGYLFIKSIKEEKDTLEIEVYLANAIKIKANPNGVEYIFKNFEYKDKYDYTVDYNQKIKEYIKDNLEKLDIYKIEFKKVNNSYKLEKYTKIKEA